MSIRIALAGNPNCGKTTLFNRLTGSAQYVGNWPGVTVEKISGPLREHKDVLIEDLPGIYSLSPRTPEELAARSCLVGDPPDVILNIVDGTHLERNLYLTTQLVELGLPVLIAVNMMDAVKKSGVSLSLEALGRAFGCKAVAMSALKGTGCMEAAELAVSLTGSAPGKISVFSGGLERAICDIERCICGAAELQSLRFFAVKAFEQEKTALASLRLSHGQAGRIRSIASAAERELGREASDLIAAARYSFIEKALRQCYSNMRRAFESTRAIDGVVTSRALALPVFIAVMFLVYFVSFFTVGELISANIVDFLCGSLPRALAAFLGGVGCPAWLISLVTDGALAGVGAVLGFLPQMFILFLMLAFLEDVGYMARAAYIMDRIFRRFGLSGSSVISLVIASGCGVPAVMSTRTIESARERRITLSAVCFVPCGAKMPMIGLFAGAFFGGSALVAALAYFMGVAAALATGLILKDLPAAEGGASSFVMELPPYRLPSASGVFRATWQRLRGFMLRAGTVILATSIALWFLKSFGVQGGTIAMAESAEGSLLASIGAAIAFLFHPLGFGTWQAAVATVSGLLGKENIVGSFAVLYGGASLSEGFSPLSAFSFLMFNLLCAPCCAAVSAMHHELKSAVKALSTALYMTCFAYAATFAAYQFALSLSGGGFGPGTVAAAAVLFIGLRMLKAGTRPPACKSLPLCGGCTARCEK